MKKTILTIAIISAFFISCNETKEKNENKETVEVHEHHGEEMVAINNDWVNEIKLDNGNKWDANLDTTQGVDKMLDIIKTSELKTVEQYHTLATNLNEEKNFVVKKCTMEGPSHDNLHVFLHPLIEKIEALGKVSTPEEGSEITKSIKENLKGYYDYFK